MLCRTYYRLKAWKMMLISVFLSCQKPKWRLLTLHLIYPVI